MKKDNINMKYKDEIPMDDYEKELKEFLDKGKFVRTKDFQKNKRQFEEAARYTLELKRTKRITLRVRNSDLIKVKVKAQKFQIPYQRLINTLIHQYAEGITKIIL